MPEAPKCDFCSTRPVVWEIPCADFQVGQGRSTGAFLACESCGVLVRTGDRDDLLLRAIRLLKHPARAIFPTHDAFWRHGRPAEIKQIAGPLEFPDIAAQPIQPPKSYQQDVVRWADAEVARTRPIAVPVHHSDRPWMEAIEMQFAALRLVQQEQQAVVQYPALKSSEMSDEEYLRAQDAALRQATTFAWSDQPTTAVLMASRSIPLSARLDAEQLIVEPCGWWWFPRPIGQVQTPGAGLRDFRALTWTLSQNADPALGRAVLFLAFVLNDEGRPIVTTGWIWSLIESLQQMLIRSDKPAREWNIRGRDSIRTLSQLFLAGQAWLQQRIVTSSSGHVERHRRKQLAREHKVPLPGDVKIIELRRRESVSTEKNPNPANVEWSCQWIVSGHWTHQVHGEKRGERRLQYILPYVKGPSDKPLRVPKQTVYVVDR